MTRRTKRAHVFSNRSPAAAFLCLHSVAEDGPPFLSIPIERFESQMATIRRLGWRSGTSADLAVLRAERRLDAPRVFLTFDDGFADNESNALAVLDQYGLTAMVFVLPPVVDVAGPLTWPEVSEHHARHPNTFRSLGWRGLDRIVESGGEVGSHTQTHPHLHRLDPESMREELLQSRQRLVERYGSCETLAYPFGDWNLEVLRAARATGYRFAFTVPSSNQSMVGPLCIPRVPLDQRDDDRRVRLKLSAYGRKAYFSRARPAAKRLLASRREDVPIAVELGGGGPVVS